MAEDFEREFVLGEEVTDLVMGKRPGAVILSISLSSEEIAALSDLAEREDKTVIEVVREGIRAWLEARAPSPSRSSPAP